MSISIRKSILYAAMLCLAFAVSTLPTLSEEQFDFAGASRKASSRYIVGQTWQGGQSIDQVIVPGRPPDDADIRMQAQFAPSATAVLLPNVPAFDWSYGCSATSAAMMVGYYDNMGYVNMYTGPTNAGLCPQNNSDWGRGECPLSATHKGYDGLLTRGHVDDYWGGNQDPYINNWTEHIWADCTGDYMGTNQSKYGSVDGATTFFFYTNGSPLYDYSGSEPNSRDGCHGIAEFARSRGYQVDSAFSQYIYGYEGNTIGFTFDQYMGEINAGRPVMIQVKGHTMVGYGYDASSRKVYLHNTWNHGYDTMTWAGKYSDMQHYGVTVLQLKSINTLLQIDSPTAYTWYDGVAVSEQLTASGGVKPYHSWSAAGDTAGVSLNPSTGLLHGTPSGPGKYLATLSVTDSAWLPQVAEKAVTIEVLPGYTISSRVQLGNYHGPTEQVPVTVTLMNAQKQVLRTVSTFLDADSKFHVDGVAPGTYYLGIKPSHWLRRVTGQVVVTDSDLEFIIR